jgi:polysaccharide pyruvyl transferase WcaK-like protein
LTVLITPPECRRTTFPVGNGGKHNKQIAGDDVQPYDFATMTAPPLPSSFVSQPDLGCGIMLYGYYGCGNLGDDLLLSMTLQGLRPLFPHARFLVRDHGDIVGLEQLGPDVSFTGVETLLVDQNRSKMRRALAYFAAWWSLLGQCRWLIFGGGTLFHARGSLTSLVLQLIVCLLARMRGVQIAALGVGVSELPKPAARCLLRAVIGLCDLFLVRDEAGLAQCRGSAARLSNDLVFGLSGIALPVGRLPPATPTIGLSVYPPVFEGPDGDRVVRELQETIRLLQGRGATVVFTVFHRSGAAIGDPPIFARIARGLGTPVEVRTLPIGTEALARALGDIQLMCGMRFHGLVLAALLGKPFVGLAHDNKISDLCRRFSMPALNPARFRAEELTAAMERALKQTPDPALLGKSAEEARRNFSALEKIIK